RGERGREAARRRRRARMQLRHLALDRARLPESGRSVAVDLEKLPTPRGRPRPVETREKAPVFRPRRRGTERGERLGDAEDPQQLGTVSKMREYPPDGQTHHESGVAQ